MVVAYKLSGWTYQLGRRLVDLPHVSLVNLVLGREVVPELLQGEASPDNLAQVAVELLRDADARETMRAGLGALRDSLGSGGASSRAAAARRIIAPLSRCCHQSESSLCNNRSTAVITIVE